jgi:thioredoxin 1
MTSDTRVTRLRGVKISQVVKSSDRPCLITILAQWSAISQLLEATLEEVIKDYPSTLNIYLVESDEDKMVMETYAIRTLPAVLLFNQGKIVKKLEGIISSKELISLIQATI